MQCLFGIAFPFTINEFGAVLSLDFNVTIDLMSAFENNSYNILFSIF